MVNDSMERLILNALLRREDVVMPGIGTLHPVRVSARCDKRGVVPPRNTVRYSRRVEGRTLVDMVAEAAGCDRQAAGEAYDRWLKRVKEGNTVNIDGVGRIANDFFTPSAEFDRRLNRAPATEIKLPVRHHAARWLVPVAVVVVIGGAAALWFGYYGRSMSAADGVRVTEQVAGNVAQVEVPTSGITPGTSVAEGADVQSSAVDSEHSALDNNSAESETTETLAVTDQTAVDKSAAGGVSASSGQPIEIEMSSLTRTLRGRYYVVFGVFSTADNASRFIERTVTANPAVVCRAYLFSEGKILISGFESDERAAAETFMKENRAICPEMWIFSK